MAKLPRWIKPVIGPTEQDAEGHKYATLRLHLRRWHPGYWLAIVRVLLGKPIW